MKTGRNGVFRGAVIAVAAVAALVPSAGLASAGSPAVSLPPGPGATIAVCSPRLQASTGCTSPAGMSRDSSADSPHGTPEGGVRAGAEGIRSTGRMLLLAGTGAAAAAAAHLGFTLARRHTAGEDV
ncbi:hypothetical protein ACFWP3_36150 [Streptomyces sp. NPDC058525]|uniref:hypothetical protein n=1 Tax=Streptomyces sp. NPDC058525 TaxID=3346538 RepID=UPI00365274D5